MIKSILLTVVLSILLVLGCQDTKQTQVVKEISSEKNRMKSEAALTKWVYDHSKQISLATCKEIVQESLKTDKPLLMLSLIEVESNFVLTAVSSKGAMGLTQVMPGIHEKELIAKSIIKERRDLFDVIPSVRAGNLVLSSCLKQSKDDVPKALELYLGGQDGWYVKRILSNLANLDLLWWKLQNEV